MIYIECIIIILSLSLIYGKRKKRITSYIGDLYGVVKNDGLGNRIAGIPGMLVLSLISKRRFHSIYFI